MQALSSIIKPSLRSKIRPRGISNFIGKLDANKKNQAEIWNNKTYFADPKTCVFTTIQERFGNRLIKSLKFPPDAVIVDIGCFIGEKLWQLKKQVNYLGIGVDISLSSLKIAKKIDIYGHKYIAADIENLPFKNKSVDVVMIFDVIEHISSPDKGFSEISRILKPNGQFLLHIPIKDNFLSLFWWKQKLLPSRALKDYLDVGHSSERMLTRKQIRRHLSEHGLIVVKEIPFNSFLVHFFDRELLKTLSGLIMSLSGKKQAQTQKVQIHRTGGLGVIRTVYGKYLVPILELLSFPDFLILSRLGIANTCFYLCKKSGSP